MSQIACPNCGAPVDSSERACSFCGAALKPSSGANASATTDFADVLEQIRRGNKIEAIKAYRAKTNASLAEAKAAVEAMQAGQPVVVPQAAWDGGGLAENAGQLSEIREQLRNGNKIEAIKIYREMTGVGLKEAKDAVEALEAGQPVVISQSSVVSSTMVAGGAAFASSAALMDEVKRLLRAEKKIDAIKAYREHFNVGLAEAKNAVDAAETELKLQSPPAVDDGIPAFARPEAAPIGPTISPNPFEEAQPPAWRKWLIGCSVAGVVFLCLCVALPAALMMAGLLNLPR
jgi:ribosomal protein L7/L12